MTIARYSTAISLRTPTLARRTSSLGQSAASSAEGSSDTQYENATSPSARRTNSRSPGVSTRSTDAVVPPLPPVGRCALKPPEPRQEARQERNPVAVDDVEALLAVSAQVKHGGRQRTYQRRLRSETRRRLHGEQARGFLIIIILVIASHPHASSSGCTQSGSPSDKSAYRTRWAAASVVTRAVIVLVRVAEHGVHAAMRALRVLVVQPAICHRQQTSATVARRECGEIRTTCSVWLSHRSPS
jgi:hypothetical protein